MKNRTGILIVKETDSYEKNLAHIETANKLAMESGVQIRMVWYINQFIKQMDELGQILFLARITQAKVIYLEDLFSISRNMYRVRIFTRELDRNGTEIRFLNNELLPSTSEESPNSNSQGSQNEKQT